MLSYPQTVVPFFPCFKLNMNLSLRWIKHVREYFGGDVKCHRENGDKSNEHPIDRPGAENVISCVHEFRKRSGSLPAERLVKETRYKCRPGGEKRKCYLTYLVDRQEDEVKRNRAIHHTNPRIG